MTGNYKIFDKDGNVENVIVADEAFVVNHYPGRYELVIEPERLHSSVITVLQLRRLFTFQEKLAVEQAIQNGNAALKVFMDDLSASSYVNLTDPLVNQGLELLVQSEIITSERKTETLEYRLDTVEIEPESDAIITILQLRRLFSFEEKVAVEEAIANGNLGIKVFMDDLAVSSHVDLADPLVAQGLDILVSSEIITEERKRQILSNEALE